MKLFLKIQSEKLLQSSANISSPLWVRLINLNLNKNPSRAVQVVEMHEHFFKMWLRKQNTGFGEEWK